MEEKKRKRRGAPHSKDGLRFGVKIVNDGKGQTLIYAYAAFDGGKGEKTLVKTGMRVWPEHWDNINKRAMIDYTMDEDEIKSNRSVNRRIAEIRRWWRQYLDWLEMLPDLKPRLIEWFEGKAMGYRMAPLKKLVEKSLAVDTAVDAGGPDTAIVAKEHLKTTLDKKYYRIYYQARMHSSKQEATSVNITFIICDAVKLERGFGLTVPSSEWDNGTHRFKETERNKKRNLVLDKVLRLLDSGYCETMYNAADDDTRFNRILDEFADRAKDITMEYGDCRVAIGKEKNKRKPYAGVGERHPSIITLMEVNSSHREGRSQDAIFTTSMPLNWLNEFVKATGIPYDQRIFTEENIRCFVRYIQEQSKKPMCINTIKQYMRSLVNLLVWYAGKDKDVLKRLSVRIDGIIDANKLRCRASAAKSASRRLFGEDAETEMERISTAAKDTTLDPNKTEGMFYDFYRVLKDAGLFDDL